MTAPTGSGGVLAVLDAEIASLPTMAAMASHGGTECDPAEAIERLTQARATVEAMADLHERVLYVHTLTGNAKAQAWDKLDRDIRDCLARFHGDTL